MYLSGGGGWDLTKQLGCVLIMLGLVWLFKENLKDNLIHWLNYIVQINRYILSVYSPFSDRIGLPLHNIHDPSPFTSIMDIFFVDLKFGHIHFYTL